MKSSPKTLWLWVALVLLVVAFGANYDSILANWIGESASSEMPLCGAYARSDVIGTTECIQLTGDGRYFHWYLACFGSGTISMGRYVRIGKTISFYPAPEDSRKYKVDGFNLVLNVVGNDLRLDSPEGEGSYKPFYQPVVSRLRGLLEQRRTQDKSPDCEPVQGVNWRLNDSTFGLESLAYTCDWFILRKSSKLAVAAITSAIQPK